MSILEKINGGPRFNEHQNLSGLVDGSKVGDGLLDALIGDTKILLGRHGWFLRIGGSGTKKKRERKQRVDQGASHKVTARRRSSSRTAPRLCQRAQRLKELQPVTSRQL